MKFYRLLHTFQTQLQFNICHTVMFKYKARIFFIYYTLDVLVIEQGETNSSQN